MEKPEIPPNSLILSVKGDKWKESWKIIGEATNAFWKFKPTSELLMDECQWLTFHVKADDMECEFKMYVPSYQNSTDKILRSYDDWTDESFKMAAFICRQEGRWILYSVKCWKGS